MSKSVFQPIGETPVGLPARLLLQITVFNELLKLGHLNDSGAYTQNASQARSG